MSSLNSKRRRADVGIGARRKEVGTRLEQFNERERGGIAQAAVLDAQIASLTAKPGVPDPDRLKFAREYRDAGWVLIRQKIDTENFDEVMASTWAKDIPMPDAYETAVLEADRAADDRFEHAEDLTSIAQLLLARQTVTNELEAIANSRTHLNREASAAAGVWEQLWLSIGVTASDPEAMTGWREEYQGLVLILKEIDKAERLLSSERETINSHAEALRMAIAELGLTPDSSNLRQLIAQAQEITADALAQSNSRKAATTSLEQATSSLPERDQAVASAIEALETWEAAWSAAMSPIQLGPEVRPPAALAAVRAYRALPGSRQEVHGFESRIRGIERDLKRFASQVSEVASGLKDPVTDNPLDFVEYLRIELAKARVAVSARDTLSSQLIDAIEALRISSIEVASAEDQLSGLRAEISLGTDLELFPIVERAQLASVHRDKISQIETTLIAQGGGRSLEVILTSVSDVGMDSDELVATIASLNDDVEIREIELAGTNQSLGEATSGGFRASSLSASSTTRNFL